MGIGNCRLYFAMYLKLIGVNNCFLNPVSDFDFKLPLFNYGLEKAVKTEPKW